MIRKNVFKIIVYCKTRLVGAERVVQMMNLIKYGDNEMITDWSIDVWHQCALYLIMMKELMIKWTTWFE